MINKKKFYENYKGYVIMLDCSKQRYNIHRPKKWWEKYIPFAFPDFDIKVATNIHDIKTAKNYIDKFLSDKVN